MGCCSSKKGSFEVTPLRPSPLTNGYRRASYYQKHPGLRPHGLTESDPMPQPRPGEKPTVGKGILMVANIDYNVTANAVEHVTSKYEMTESRIERGVRVTPQLVVRRGAPFDITVTFNREYDSTTDDLKLVFDRGDLPLESKGTRVCMLLSDEDKVKQWGARILRTDGCDLHVRVFTPPTCAVSKWKFKVDSIYKEKETVKVFRYTHPHDMYILFNPWCPDDQVYMDDEQCRQEYVLNDRGRIWKGNAKQFGPVPWNFGQFEDFILECSMYLLDKVYMNNVARGDPVLVSRRISALVNSADDQGVLVGNWSSSYAGGRSPNSWVGSVAILAEYWKNLKPVKYGQCWVFSGIVTTVCRCLGIPARSVTNFSSAHDTDGTITLDKHFANGKPYEKLNRDMSWTFHVWNDVWMARPDLPSGFGGWQAIDSTPQETSDGVYQAGPCSVEAIKNGLVTLPYDGAFVFAEVNADVLIWIMVEDGSWTCIKKIKENIGHKMSTKSPYSDERNDITHLYKFPERSPQERTALWRAIREGATRQLEYENEIEDMVFDMTEREDTMYGEPFNVTLKVINNSKETRTVKVTLTATVIYYTGVPVEQLKSVTYTLTAPANAQGEVVMPVTVKEYIDKLVDHCNIKISCMVHVLETKQYYVETDDFRLLKPDLTIKAPTEVTEGAEYDVEVFFTNPLPKALTKCTFHLEGAGLQAPLTIKHKNVGASKEARIKTTLTAKRAGTRELIVGFDSLEIAAVTGVTTIKVNPLQESTSTAV